MLNVQVQEKTSVKPKFKFSEVNVLNGDVNGVQGKLMSDAIISAKGLSVNAGCGEISGVKGEARVGLNASTTSQCWLYGY